MRIGSSKTGHRSYTHFHIHQIHFMLLDWYGLPVNEPFLRDTVNVPFWDGKATVYPMVKLRMDFRDPNTQSALLFITAIFWSTRMAG